MFAVPDVMKFVVQAEAGHTDAIPESLRPMETLDPMDAVTTRNFVLRKLSNPCNGSMWLINDLQWDDITEYPVLGTTEIWSFVNRSGISHPMHMHLVFFQILDRQDFQVIEGEVVPIGSPVPPAANEAGWKDTVMTHPYQITRVIARFEDYTGLYPYHCHILEHEDHEMMRQFEAVCIKGDTNQDTLVDGRDISLFVEAIIGTVEAGTAQFCATDMDSNLALETAYDINLFVDCLVAGNCP
jgi:spore coat protein A